MSADPNTNDNQNKITESEAFLTSENNPDNENIEVDYDNNNNNNNNNNNSDGLDYCFVRDLSFNAGPITDEEMKILNDQFDMGIGLGISKVSGMNKFVTNLEPAQYKMRNGGFLFTGNVLFRVTVYGNPKLLRFVQKYSRHEVKSNIDNTNMDFQRIDECKWKIDEPYYENNALEKILCDAITVDSDRNKYTILVYDCPQNRLFFRSYLYFNKRQTFSTYVKSYVPDNFNLSDKPKHTYDTLKFEWGLKMNVSQNLENADIRVKVMSVYKIHFDEKDIDVYNQEFEKDWAAIQNIMNDPNTKVEHITGDEDNNNSSACAGCLPL